MGCSETESKLVELLRFRSEDICYDEIGKSNERRDCERKERILQCELP